MKTYKLPKGAVIKWITIDDKPVTLNYHRMDWAYWLFTTRDWTIVNIGASQEREEKDWEYWIA